MIRGYRFFGIISIVNMIGSQSPFVFIGAKPIKQYIDDLKIRFPEEEKRKLTKTNKGKRLGIQFHKYIQEKFLKHSTISLFYLQKIGRLFPNISKIYEIWYSS